MFFLLKKKDASIYKQCTDYCCSTESTPKEIKMSHLEQTLERRKHNHSKIVLYVHTHFVKPISVLVEFCFSFRDWLNLL